MNHDTHKFTSLSNGDILGTTHSSNVGETAVVYYVLESCIVIVNNSKCMLIIKIIIMNNSSVLINEGIIFMLNAAYSFLLVFSHTLNSPQCYYNIIRCMSKILTLRPGCYFTIIIVL